MKRLEFTLNIRWLKFATAVATASAIGSTLSSCSKAQFNFQSLAAVSSSSSSNSQAGSSGFSKVFEFVFGQSSETSNYNYTYGLSNPQSIYSDGTRLFVADTNNHRVLIWNSLPTANQTQPDVVLGQPNFLAAVQNNSLTGAGNPSARSLSSPSGVFSDGTKLYVSDSGNNRVLIWNSIPTSNYAAATLVLGQTTFFSNSYGATATRLSNPISLLVAGGKLIVTDQYNYRVLIWNSIPSVSGVAADVVIGQSNFISQASGTTQVNYQLPYGLASDGTKLFVSDLYSNRILVYNSIPVTNGVAADAVLGQSTFTVGSVNAGGLSAKTLYYPRGLFATATHLYVSDSFNNRILRFQISSLVTFAAADQVYGQQLFTNVNYFQGYRNYINSAYSLYTDGSKLFVADNNQNRILIWNNLASYINSPPSDADLVQGQPSYTSIAANNFSITNSQAVRGSISTVASGMAAQIGSRMYYADKGSNRILIWNSIPNSSATLPDLVWGQSSFNNSIYYVGSTTTTYQTNSIASDGLGGMVVADGYHRISIWNTAPSSGTDVINKAIGQNSFANYTYVGCTSSTFSSPSHAVVANNKLIVTDRGHNRVLIFNNYSSLPSGANLIDPDLVIGQLNLTSCASNQSGIADANTLSSPTSAWSDGTNLIVADTGNNRVLIWQTFPTSNGQPADLVVGQINFSGSSQNYGGVSSASLNGPTSLAVSNSRLYVVDQGNHRIMVYNAIPQSVYQSADYVMGQDSFALRTPNYGGISSNYFYSPLSISFNGTRALISDSGNFRILSYQFP